jgi:RHS repeat-associated protein
LAEAYTCSGSCSSKTTDEGSSYTARGELSDVYQSTPNSGGYYHLSATYFANGALNQLSGLPSLPTITDNVDGEGRLSNVSAASGQNPVTGTTYNTASQPTQVTLGSLDSDAFTFDPNTNRMTQYKFSVNGQAEVGNLTWNAIGTLASLAITDPFNSADNQTCTYAHDDLARIASVNCGASIWQDNFSYDVFGNISKTVPTGGTGVSFQATYSTSTNHITQIAGSTPTYDANGNVTNDFLHTYTWDADGHALTADGVGLTYDALGRTVEQNKSGTYTQVIYAPTGQEFAFMSGQSLSKAYVSLPAGVVAVYNSSGLANYQHVDWLGSFRLQSSPTRTVLSEIAYGPFGETYAQTGSGIAAFTGMTQDTEANLYDFPAREYGTQGRWPSPDPAGLDAVDPSNPQSWNRFVYVANSALNSIDPSVLQLPSSGASSVTSAIIAAPRVTNAGRPSPPGRKFGFTPQRPCTKFSDCSPPPPDMPSPPVQAYLGSYVTQTKIPSSLPTPTSTLPDPQAFVANIFSYPSKNPTAETQAEASYCLGLALTSASGGLASGCVSSLSPQSNNGTLAGVPGSGWGPPPGAAGGGFADSCWNSFTTACGGQSVGPLPVPGSVGGGGGGGGAAACLDVSIETGICLLYVN